MQGFCPWGPVKDMTFVDENRTRAFVWAEYGKGIMILEEGLTQPDKERNPQKINGIYWLEGISQK